LKPGRFRPPDRLMEMLRPRKRTENYVEWSSRNCRQAKHCCDQLRIIIHPA
jgi:hypothetical protein